MEERGRTEGEEEMEKTEVIESRMVEREREENINEEKKLRSGGERKRGEGGGTCSKVKQI